MELAFFMEKEELKERFIENNKPLFNEMLKIALGEKENSEAIKKFTDDFLTLIYNQVMLNHQIGSIDPNNEKVSSMIDRRYCTFRIIRSYRMFIMYLRLVLLHYNQKSTLIQSIKDIIISRRNQSQYIVDTIKGDKLNSILINEFDEELEQFEIEIINCQMTDLIFDI